MKFKESDKNDDSNNFLQKESPYNRYIYKTLFMKNIPKIKTDVEFTKNLQNNNDIFLNPFNNSYGNILQNMTGKVGFIKRSIDILYPKIIEEKNKLIEKRKNALIARRMIKDRNSDEYNKDNIYTLKKEKKIVRSLFTKYPRSINKCTKKFVSKF